MVNTFFILPLNELMNLQLPEHEELINKLIWEFISDLLDDSIEDINSFLSKYDSIDEIENILLNNKNINAFFYDLEDKNLSLKKNIK